MTRLVILKVKRRVLKRKVREQTFRTNATRELEKIVVRLARSNVDSFLYAENMDGKNRRLTRSQPRLMREEHVLNDETTFGGDVHAVVNGRERRLRARATVHCVKVVDQRFHGLIGGAIGFGGCLNDRFGLNFCEEF